MRTLPQAHLQCQPAHEVRIGKFPFQFSGRALAAGETEGFVKLVFDAKYGELLAHLIGAMATEMISELVMAKKLEAPRKKSTTSCTRTRRSRNRSWKRPGKGWGSR